MDPLHLYIICFVYVTMQVDFFEKKIKKIKKKASGSKSWLRKERTRDMMWAVEDSLAVSFGVLAIWLVSLAAEPNQWNLY